MGTTTACSCWWFPLLWGLRWDSLVWGKVGASLGLRTSWGRCGIKLALAEEKMEIRLFLHRDQIHWWKRKTSCPTNMLKEKSFSPFTQEPSDWKGQNIHCPQCGVYPGRLSPWKRQEWGRDPCRCCFLLVWSKKLLILGGRSKGSRAGLCSGGVCFSLWL